jgi:hypothetical protein
MTEQQRLDLKAIEYNLRILERTGSIRMQDIEPLLEAAKEADQLRQRVGELERKTKTDDLTITIVTAERNSAASDMRRYLERATTAEAANVVLRGAISDHTYCQTESIECNDCGWNQANRCVARDPAYDMRRVLANLPTLTAERVERVKRMEEFIDAYDAYHDSDITDVELRAGLLSDLMHAHRALGQQEGERDGK